MVEQVDAPLQSYDLLRLIDHMKISRLDLTCDLTFKEAGIVGEYIRTLQKSFVLSHYKRVLRLEAELYRGANRNQTFGF